MSKKKDLTGQTFGHLHVIKQGETRKSENSLYSEITWICQCDCGNIIEVPRSNLLRGRKTNCGCIKSPPKIKHGMAYSKIEQKWIGMKQRCYNPNDAEYKNYGGRGIRVCNEWLGRDGAEHFIKWAFDNGWDESRNDLSIDRIDVNGDYCPENCRFIGIDVQSINKTNTIMIDYQGEKKPLCQLCKEFDVNYSTAYGRYKKGFSTEKILFNKPWESDISGGRKKVQQIDKKTGKIIAEYNSIKEAAIANNSNPRCIGRVCRGERKSWHGYEWEVMEN